MDWQQVMALGIVLLTVALMVRGCVRRRREKSCGHGCGCAASRDSRPE